MSSDKRDAVVKIEGHPSDEWNGPPGRRFMSGLRELVRRLSGAVRRSEVAQDLAATAVRYVEGEASSKYAGAVKDLNEAEVHRAEADLRRQTMEAEIAIKNATARKMAADATVAEIDAAERQIRFIKEHGGEEHLADLLEVFERHSLVLEELAPGRFRLRQAKLLPSSRGNDDSSSESEDES